MIEQKHCFTKLEVKCTVLEELRDLVKQTDWTKAADSDLQTFMFTTIPFSIVEKDKVLRTYAVYNDAPKIFYMPAWTYYSLHTDSNRKSAINMAIDDSDSASFFAANRFRTNQFRTIELQYEPGSYYVFNTQIKHGVYNRGQDRFVVSTGLGPKVSYFDAVRIAKENKLL